MATQGMCSIQAGSAAVGFYECVAGDKHSWSVNVRGHRFPPLPDGCKGGGWVLKNTTAAADALHGVSKAMPGVETSREP